MTFRAGVHLPNDGRMTGEDWDLVGGLGLVKGLVRLDNMGQWGEVDWPELGRRLRPDCTVMLRLFFQGWLDPREFVLRASERLGALTPALSHGERGSKGEREILVEIHNEPNHAQGLEGWGPEEDEARDFAWWYSQVLTDLRLMGKLKGYYKGNHKGLSLQFGWPGLALGEWAHGERTWLGVNRANIRKSDWIGCHAYWQRPGEIDDVRLGGNWRYYRRRWPKRRVFVTEVGNSSCHNPELPQMTEERQRAEYLAWCRAAEAGGVAGAAFYMLGGSEDWKGFRLWPGTVRALAS